MRQKQKIWGSHCEKLSKRVIEATAVTQKVQQKYRDIACKANFSLLIWDRQLKFMFQHPRVWFDRKQLKYLSKELLLYDFLHKRSTDVWKTVTNNAGRPLCFKTSGNSSLVILETDLTSKLLRYVPLSSRTLWKVLFWPVWNLRWLPTL